MRPSLWASCRNLYTSTMNRMLMYHMYISYEELFWIEQFKLHTAQDFLPLFLLRKTNPAVMLPAHLRFHKSWSTSHRWVLLTTSILKAGLKTCWCHRLWSPETCKQPAGKLQGQNPLKILNIKTFGLWEPINAKRQHVKSEKRNLSPHCEPKKVLLQGNSLGKCSLWIQYVNFLIQSSIYLHIS